MSDAKHHGIVYRLYHGETTFPLIQRRKGFYVASLLLVLVAAGSMVFRGFNLGVEFKGGVRFTVPNSAKISVEDTRTFIESKGFKDPIVQTLNSTSGAKSLRIETDPLTVKETEDLANALATKFKVTSNDVTSDSTGSSWGSDVSKKALRGLIIFLIVVTFYIWIRFELKMAAAAMIALIHDLILAAGVYSILGFVVTPSTVVALLTVLGYSLYDTVVVFDKVAENTKGIEKQSQRTYAEAAELAVNQTFMRSINTSLIALLPVSGLLFVGALLLGAGTLKDLALALFVGLASGAYSSLFLATPLLSDLKEREPQYQQLHQRVLDRRRTGKAPVRLSQRSANAGPDAAAEVPADSPVATTTTRTPTKPKQQQGKRKPKGSRPTGKRKR
ncbi:MAG: protein-export rane protein SecF [Frankiales bacterium]|nr:protein-export rane protein SecF [Frankiales bacterium]